MALLLGGGKVQSGGRTYDSYADYKADRTKTTTITPTGSTTVYGRKSEGGVSGTTVSAGSANKSGASVVSSQKDSTSSIQPRMPASPGTNLPQGAQVAGTMMDGIKEWALRDFRQIPQDFQVLKGYWDTTMDAFAKRVGAVPRSPAGGDGSVGGGFGGGSGGSSGGSVFPETPDRPTVPTSASTTRTPSATPAAPSTGGASASGGRPGDRQLTEGELAAAYRLIAALAPGSPSSITSTSDDFSSAVQGMGDALNSAYEKALADLPDYDKMRQDSEDLYKMKMGLIDDRRDQLEERYREDREGIEADFEGQKQDLGAKQKTEVGKLSGGLAAAGAYLGFDNVNHSAMLSLQVTHDREMTVLGQAKVAAVNEARRAFEDSDFALLGEQINAIESYDTKISELAQDHFDNTLKLTAEARQNVQFGMEMEKFERDKGFDNLDAVITSGVLPTNREIERYAATLNLSPEQVRKYIESGINTKALQESRDKIAQELDIIGVLKGIDTDQSITIGGKSYRGLNKPKSSSDSSTRILNNEDVMNKFNSSPFAYAMVGDKTYGEVVELYSQEFPNAQWLGAWEESNADILDQYGYKQHDPDTYGVYYDMYLNAWNTEKANFWGVQFATPLNEFSVSDRQKIVGYLLSTGEITSENDLRNRQDWSYAKLSQVLAEAVAAAKGDQFLTAEQFVASQQEGAGN